MSAETGEKWHDEVISSQTESEYTPPTTVQTPGSPMPPDPDTQGHLLHPGFSYLIQSVATGKFITFAKGKIVLDPIAGYSSTRWECIENDGWLGFRDPASYMLLGYIENENEELGCQFTRHDICERFQVREVEERIYHMLVIHVENWGKQDRRFKLLPIVHSRKDGQDILIKTKSNSNAAAWRFIRVQ
ncbi:unnamed protein product [Periconia digitata]|uniref:Uncharacterized protein n=1 Tax=Periconia digitata TaxID=1303443 RepID=A0A9W4UMV9_9PLEO|nr:unnamed protein product [Periconia digitata]